MKIKRIIEFDLLKTLFFKQRACIIDNFVHRLHYQATAIILIVFCLFGMSRQFFGTPIQCDPSLGIDVSDDDDLDDPVAQFVKMINHFCWIQSTFSVRSSWKKKVDVEVPYPGIDINSDPSLKTYHSYYQWVCFFLLTQSIMFCVPHFIWKQSESSIVHKLVNGLDQKIMNIDDRKKRIDLTTQYLSKTVVHYDTKFMVYTISEILNLCNIIVQFMLVDWFLGGQFAFYGLSAITFTGYTDFPLSYDPMMKVFPRQTKCTFYQFGSSGDIQRHDSLCVLPINILYEKVYLFLWFWFIILAFLSALSLIYRIILIFSFQLRLHSLKIRTKYTKRKDLKEILKSCSISGWFVLILIAKNMENKNFQQVIARLKVKLNEQQRYR